MHTTRRLVTPSTACAVALIALTVGLRTVRADAPAESAPRLPGENAADRPALERAQRLFFNGDYDRAAALAGQLCQPHGDDLDACELNSVSLLFQIKRELGRAGAVDKTTAWSRCTACPALMSAFLAETARSQTLARARLKTSPDDEATLFFLGKVDLNYVWLQLGTLGRKTGWDEYWEARRSLDQALRRHPGHVRARVARAWVDYIVGTAVPRGVRWLLGGGNKKRGLLAVRDAVARGSDDFFVQAEATFALWDMQVREHDMADAVVTARTLARDFPENVELRTFLMTHDPVPPLSVSGAIAP